VQADEKPCGLENRRCSSFGCECFKYSLHYEKLMSFRTMQYNMQENHGLGKRDPIINLVDFRRKCRPRKLLASLWDEPEKLK